MKKIIIALCFMASFKAMSQCPNTASITITPTPSGGLVVWAAAAGATQYSIAVFTHPANVWTGFNVVTAATTVTVTGLSPSTQYRFQIASLCSGSTSTGADAIFTTTSNRIIYTPMTAIGYSFKYMKVDSLFHLSTGDTSLKRGDTRAGAVVFKNSDSLFYGYNGLKWAALGGNFSSLLTEINKKVDTIFYNTDTIFYKKNNIKYGIVLGLGSGAYTDSLKYIKYDGTVQMEAPLIFTGMGGARIGSGAGNYNIGEDINALGDEAAFGNSGSDVNALGLQAGKNNTFSQVNLFGRVASATENAQTVFSKDGSVMARLGYGNLTDSRLYTLPDSSGTLALNSSVLNKLNISDTATMLSSYVWGAGFGLSKSSKYFLLDTANTSVLSRQRADAKYFSLPSLTSGSVLFSNGTTITQDNAHFFWNNTSKRLGISTPTPGAKLEIAGVANQLRLSDSANTANHYNIYRNGSTGYLDFQGSQATFNGFRFNNNSGSIIVQMTPTQMLGIGKPPTVALDVNGAAAISGALTIGGDISDGALYYTNATGRLVLGNTPTGTFMGGNGEIQARRENANATIRIQTAANSSQSYLAFDRTRGTIASPTAVQSGDVLGSIVALGYQGTGGSLDHSSEIFFKTTENWSSTNKGTDITFKVIPTGTTAQTTSMYMRDGSVGVGNVSSVASSAILEATSTTKGFLPPRMTATEASAISSPAEGLMVYVTNTNGTFTTKGWWGYNGATWEKLNN